MTSKLKTHFEPGDPEYTICMPGEENYRSLPAKEHPTSGYYDRTGQIHPWDDENSPSVSVYM
jgi:hypothetical protein